MSRIFITGSADGLGFLAAESLLSQGHQVVLHARNSKRARDVITRLPMAEGVVTGDLSVLKQIRSVAEQCNQLGLFDAVIHNAGVYTNSNQGYIKTEDGLPMIFAVNTLAPYMLTARMNRPRRLVYLSSDMHFGANADLSDIEWKRRSWNAAVAYAESKLYVVVLMLVVARYWPDVLSNAVDPGWVPTKMGGPSATGDLSEGYRTQTWLAVADENEARVSGKYFHHRHEQAPDPVTMDESRQDRLVSRCRQVSGIRLQEA